MSRHAFASAVLLLLFVLMCCGCGAAYAVKREAGKPINPFTGTTRISSQWNEIQQTGGTVGSLRAPSLVKVNDDVFAIAEAHCKKGAGAKGCTGIASRHLKETGAASTRTEISAAVTSVSCAQLSEGDATKNRTRDVMGPTTLVSGNDIYMLFGKYSRAASSTPPADGSDHGLFLTKGSVVTDGDGKKIKWTETHSLNPASYALMRSLTGVVATGGSGVVLQEGTLAFPVQATDKDGNSFLLALRFLQPENKWEFSVDTVGKGCRDPSIVEWEGEKVLMAFTCADGYRDVYMSTATGKDWKDKGETITRVWGNSRDRTGYGARSGFATATVEDRTVLLLTTPVYSGEQEGRRKGRLHLWVTDNTRVYDVGPVSDESDDAGASSLLYKNEKELILLYERKSDDGSSLGLVSVRLTEQLGRIRTVVKRWKEVDNTIRRHDSSFIDGLAGFLAGNFTGTEWRDEYLCVDATVQKGVTSTTRKGLTFEGPGAGAKWPVGKLWQNQPYYFANNEFTLVATVTIHEVPKEGPIPLMGVRMNDTDGTVLFGLSYTRDRKWSPIFNNVTVNPYGGMEWRTNTRYQVALRMKSDDCAVFIDGEEVADETTANAEFFTPHRISYFYLGGDGTDKSAEGSHVTVTDVLLYNRKVFPSELKKLKMTPFRTPHTVASVQVPQPAATQPTVTEKPQVKKPATPRVEAPKADASRQTVKQKQQMKKPVKQPAATQQTVKQQKSVEKPAVSMPALTSASKRVNPKPTVTQPAATEKPKVEKPAVSMPALTSASKRVNPKPTVTQPAATEKPKVEKPAVSLPALTSASEPATPRLEAPNADVSRKTVKQKQNVTQHTVPQPTTTLQQNITQSTDTKQQEHKEPATSVARVEAVSTVLETDSEPGTAIAGSGLNTETGEGELSQRDAAEPDISVHENNHSEGSELSAETGEGELSQRDAAEPDISVHENNHSEGSELSAETGEGELSQRDAAEHDTPIHENNHSEFEGSVVPDAKLSALSDAKSILQRLNGDSTVRVFVSLALVPLLLGLCGVVAVV